MTKAPITIALFFICACESPPDAPMATCQEIAEAVCFSAAECFPAFPVDWCIEQELDLCLGWDPGPGCRDELAELTCVGSSVTVPASCQ